MRTRLIGLLPGIFALLASDRANAQAAALPDPDQVYIAGLAYNGTGCPSGTAGAHVAPDGTSFTMAFTKLVASAGPGLPLSSGRKNCAISLQLHIPGGFSVAIQSVEYVGKVQLDAGVTASQVTTNWFQGSLLQEQTSMAFAGPLAAEPYDRMDTVPMQNLVFSPCGGVRTSNINVEARVNNAANPSGKGSLSVDAASGTVETIFHISFQPCT
jgi:hypothetical protein